jgi:hypothetical protein
MRALLLVLLLCSAPLCADDFLDEASGLFGVKLGAQQSQVFKILGWPESLDQPESDGSPVDGCRTRAIWPRTGGTFTVCFNGANKVFFMALYTHEPTVVGSIRLGTDTLATIERFRNKVLTRTCDLDEGHLTGAVSFRGHNARAEILLSSTNVPSEDERCPGNMVVNRVAIWMKADAPK